MLLHVMGPRPSTGPSHAVQVTPSQVGTPLVMMCAHCRRSVSWSAAPRHAISHSKIRVDEGSRHGFKENLN